MRNALVIGTRGSSLSLCQTQIVQVRLEERVFDRRFVVKTIKATADRQPDAPLVAMSGEGIFVKELETALLKGEIDLAVHSMKDLPLQLPKGLCVAAVTERQDARDAFVSRSGHSFEELPPGSRVGTSSLRRRSQMLFARRDLEMMDIRGNVDTRLRKLDEGRYDAVVLAACGLIRLGLDERISEYLSFESMLPEPGQGALAVEVRADDRDLQELVGGLDDPSSRACVEAERAFLRALGGGCRVPIAAYASCAEGILVLEGAVIAADGHDQIRGGLNTPMAEPIALGERLAQQLIERGARSLLGVSTDISGTSVNTTEKR